MRSVVNYPDTGNITLDRCLMWYRLVREMGKLRGCRSQDVWKMGNIELDMGNVIDGYTLVEGDYCASACCAIGSAALYHWFNKQGLTPAIAPLSEFRLDGMSVMLEGVRQSYRSEAVAEFFGLDFHDYCLIVDPDTYFVYKIPPDLVLSRMREIIKNTYDVDPDTHSFIQGLAA